MALSWPYQKKNECVCSQIDRIVCNVRNASISKFIRNSLDAFLSPFSLSSTAVDIHIGPSGVRFFFYSSRRITRVVIAQFCSYLYTLIVIITSFRLNRMHWSFFQDILCSTIFNPLRFKCVVYLFTCIHASFERLASFMQLSQTNAMHTRSSFFSLLPYSFTLH